MTFQEIPIPDDMVEEAKEYREKLLEAVAEFDETLLEKFFDDPNSISEKEILTALRQATIRHEDCSNGMWIFFQEQGCSNHA